MPFSSTDSLNSTVMNNTLRGLYRDNSDHTVSGTTSATSLAQTNITGNTIGATGGIWAIAAGSSSGSGGTKQISFGFGGATIGAFTCTVPSGSVSWSMMAYGFNTATNAQRWSLIYIVDNQSPRVTYVTTSIDTTSTQSFYTQAQLASGSDTLTCSMFDVFVCQIT